MKFLRILFAVCHKDILSEVRKREKLNILLFFSLIIIFLFSLSFGTDPLLLKKIAPGLLWVVVLFSSLLALAESFEPEVEEGTIDRIILYAANLEAVFLGKFITQFLFIALIQLFVFFFMFILFDLTIPPGNGPELVLSLLLGSFGIAALGTFYSGLIIHTKAKQVMLPLLLFPMLIPLLLSAVLSTQYALDANVYGNAGVWLTVLTIFDGVFFVASLLAFRQVLEV